MRYILLIMIQIPFIFACTKDYVRDSINIFNEAGVNIGLVVQPEEGFIYSIGPFLRFVTDNQSGDNIVLFESILNIGGEHISFDDGRLYDKDSIVINEPLPIILKISNKYKSTRLPPDPEQFQPGKIPATIRVRFQMDGVNREIEKKIEITVK